jgi:hypothetical protein
MHPFISLQPALELMTLGRASYRDNDMRAVSSLIVFSPSALLIIGLISRS